VYAADPGTWEKLANTPFVTTPGQYFPSGQSMISDGQGNMYLTGGYKGNWLFDSGFYKYSASSDSWEQLANMPSTPGRGSAIYDNNGHMFWCQSNYGTNFWEYDIATNVWAQKASGPTNFWGNAGVYTGSNTAYFTGGLWDGNLWKYDTVNDNWSHEATLPSPFGHADMAYDGEDTLYLTVSYPGDYTIPIPDFYEYSLSSGLLTRLPDIVFGNSPIHQLDYAGNSKIFFSNSSSDFGYYDILESKWESLGKLPFTPGDNDAIYDKLTDSIYYSTGDTSNEFWRYKLNDTPAAVPEPPAMVAALVMLIPFGFKKLRSMRK